jgi:hypothetical protein
MTEPTTTVAASVGLGALLASTLVGVAPWAPVLVGAGIGVLHPLSKQDFSSSHARAVFYAFRWVATAAIFTGFVSFLLETYVHFPASKWPSVVAFLIAFLADRWPAWADQIGDAVARRLGKKVEGNP